MARYVVIESVTGHAAYFGTFSEASAYRTFLWEECGTASLLTPVRIEVEGQGEGDDDARSAILR